MLNDKYKKVVLSSSLAIPLMMLSFPELLVAFPEPFDMHNAIPELVREMQEKQNLMNSQDPNDYIKGMEMYWKDKLNGSSSSNSRETSNDVDTGNSQDCR